jgi:hypothetical protein
MMRQIRLTGVLVAALSVASMPVASGDDEHDLGLVTLMGSLQYYTHKLGLAVDAGNKALVGFYAHEVEEVIEAIEEIEEYDEVAIGKLTKELLVPAFETFEAAFDAGDRQRLDAGLDGLIAACNQCHEASNHFYLVMERRRDNPFMQRFEPVDAPPEPN